MPFPEPQSCSLATMCLWLASAANTRQSVDQRPPAGQHPHDAADLVLAQDRAIATVQLVAEHLGMHAERTGQLLLRVPRRSPIAVDCSPKGRPIHRILSATAPHLCRTFAAPFG